MLAEQAGAWFYKRNLGDGKLGAMERVPRPSIARENSGERTVRGGGTIVAWQQRA